MNTIHALSSDTLTALFDSRRSAEDAINRLVDAGVPRRAVRLVPGHEDDGSDLADFEVHRGLFQSLAEFFMPEADKFSYAEGLRRGGYMVSVSNPPAVLADIAVDILDEEGAIDLDLREEDWRAEGWRGYEADEDEGDGVTGERFEQGELEGLRRDGRYRVRAYRRESAHHEVQIDDTRSMAERALGRA